MDVEITILLSDDRPSTVTIAKPCVGEIMGLRWQGNRKFDLRPRYGATICATGPIPVSSRMATLRISIVLASGARIGPGKAALLESIRDTGSISAAARDMGMDYKRAWLLLDSMNGAFEEPVVSAAPGGARGGGARLTPFGAELLARYRSLEASAAALAETELAPIAARALPESGPKV